MAFRRSGPRRVAPFSIALAAWTGIFGASCTAHRAALPDARRLPVPPAFGQRGGEGTLKEAWWKDIGDPTLNDWIAQGVAEGFDVRRARARLEQAVAIAEAAGAERWPVLTFEAGVRRARSLLAAGPQAGQTSTATLWSAGLAAAYELDVWGRLGAHARAARREVRASEDDLATVRLTLAAELTEAWLQAREQRAQLRLLREQIETSRAFLALTERRFAEGQTSALDVLQQRQQTAALEAQLPAIEARYATLRHQIAVLAGRAPAEAPEPDAGLPPLPPLPDPGVPGDLLFRRPDVRAALERWAAADERAASAAAARLPALRLSASAGYQSDSLASLFDTWIGQMAANLAAPLLDGGRRAAEARRAAAAGREQAAAAAQTLLRAVREVEDALVREAAQRETLARIEAQSALAAETLEAARTRYVAGLSDYLTVLTALERQQELDRRRLATQAQAWGARIQLYRALGGGFYREGAPP